VITTAIPYDHNAILKKHPPNETGKNPNLNLNLNPTIQLPNAP
jgi:hypothetical protein